jgi:hypothetical protein
MIGKTLTFLGASLGLSLSLSHQPTVLTDPLRKLRIIALKGQDGVNRLTEEVYATPVVEVRNANYQPVEGALVSFRILDSSGASGAVFQGGSKLKQIRTDAGGQAVADGFLPKGEGAFRVEVTAEFEGLRAALELRQRNTATTVLQERAGMDRKRNRKWRWIAIAAAGGVGAGVWAARRGGSTGTVPVTVIPGPVVIGR